MSTADSHLQFIDFSSPALFGADPTHGLVGCALLEGRIHTWWRQGSEVQERSEEFSPFLWLSDPELVQGFEGEVSLEELAGSHPFRYLARTASFEDITALSRHIAKVSGCASNSPDSPQIFINDSQTQYLLTSGHTYFKGLRWEDAHMLWLYALAQDDPNGGLREQLEAPLWVLGAMFGDEERYYKLSDYTDERSLLKQFLADVAQYDPDIIAGHLLYDDILPYLAARCKRYRLKFTLGRSQVIPKSRSVRQKIAEKNLDYHRWDVAGRELIDTWVLAQLYDVSARNMESYELSDVAAELSHEKEAEAFETCMLQCGQAVDSQRQSASTPDGAEGRDNGDSPEPPFPAQSCLEAGLEVARQGLRLSRQITVIMGQSYFLQAQMFPYSLQNVITRGNATRINSLFLREYLRQRQALPARVQAQNFSGGLTTQEYSGLAHDVYHCDVQSLYPSVMLHYHIRPQSDSLDIFLSMLEQLRTFRLQAKELAKREQSREGAANNYSHYHALQTAFKVLINSFYGYLGFEQGTFADYEAAAQVTAQGREILQNMIDWLKGRGCTIIEVDTDGIYFMAPPASAGQPDQRDLIEALNQTLPPAINLEFDGHYKAMFCHKKKNYALLDLEDNITLRGSALRARNVEPFLRETLMRMVSLALHDSADAIPALLDEVAEELSQQRIPLVKLAKTDTLISSPESYREKMEKGGRNRAAAYELALQAPRPHKAGDKITYYVTGNSATVSVWQNAKLLSQAPADGYDANIKYYLSKLKDLSKKFKF